MPPWGNNSGICLFGFSQVTQFQYSGRKRYPDRSNVIGNFPGRNPDQQQDLRRTACARIEGMVIPPFNPTLSGGRMYGSRLLRYKGRIGGDLRALRTSRGLGKVPYVRGLGCCRCGRGARLSRGSRTETGLQAGATIVANLPRMKMTAASKSCFAGVLPVTGKSAHGSGTSV